MINELGQGGAVEALTRDDVGEDANGAKGELGINVTLLGAAANFGDPVRILPEPPRRLSVIPAALSRSRGALSPAGP